MTPKKFNAAWLEKAAPDHINAGRWGAGVEMKLDDGSEFLGA